MPASVTDLEYELDATAIINFARARAAARETGGELLFIGRGVGMVFGLLGVVLLARVLSTCSSMEASPL
ncbi:hypothetical protein B0H19DRAFT_1277763 [Mycena capillaripes]|nr:hypothetical protein B0H19DRAFT_1277763 [Mycena capillaripes]